MKLMIKSCFVGLLVMGAVSLYGPSQAATSQNVSLLGEITNFPDEIRDIEVVGNYAYVAAKTAGLRIIDISNSSTPNEVGHFDTPGWANGVKINGNYAYVADSGGLQIINISIANSPTAMGQYNITGISLKITLHNNYAYVAVANDGIVKIDISTPSNPSGEIIYNPPLFNNFYDITTNGTHNFVAGYGYGLGVFDLANTSKLDDISTTDEALAVEVMGNYAYVADNNGGLRIINISDPYNLSETGHYNTSSNAIDLSISGNYAYLATGKLQVINIADPSNTFEHGFYSVTSLNVQSVTISNNKIYMGDGPSYTFSILEFVPPIYTATPSSTPSPTPTSTPSISPSPTISATLTSSPTHSPTATITSTPIPPIVANYVAPNYQVANNTVTTSIVGKNFLASPIVKLQKTGEPDITATNVIVKSSFLLTCVFDLVNASHGIYDLFLDRGNSQGTLAKSFTVLRPITETSKWQVKDIGNCGVPLATGRQNGITIADPDNDTHNELYITNRNNNFHQFKFLGASWTRSDLPSAVGSERYHDVLAFDKDLDSIPELYMAAHDHHVYSYSGPSWTKSDLGFGSGPINALAIGDGNNDGEIELYGASEDSHVYQFKWNGSSWNPTDMGVAAGALKSITVGDGNNDNLFEVYVASSDHNIYQYTYTSSWAVVDIGSGAGTMTGVVVADLEDDDKNAVYGANEDGAIYQFKKTTAWNTVVIGNSNSNNAFFEIVASDGDNAGMTRLYGASGDGNIYQFDYSASNWSSTVIGECGTPLYDLAIGDGRNDYHHELFAIGENSHVYELKYESTIATATPTATVTATITPIDGFSGKLIDKKYTYFAPNPVRGKNMKFVVHVPRQCNIEGKLYTTSNKFVLSFNLDCPGPGKYEHSEYVGNLANGVYLLLVKAKSTDGTSERLVKKLGLIK